LVYLPLSQFNFQFPNGFSLISGSLGGRQHAPTTFNSLTDSHPSVRQGWGWVKDHLSIP